jgi:hypothetical protein
MARTSRWRLLVASLALIVGLAGCLNPASVPPPAPGADGPRLEAAHPDYPPYYTGPGDVGAFRTECESSFTDDVDPIMFHGQGTPDGVPDGNGPSHEHNFFGPTAHPAFTSTPTAAPASSCYGGTLNRTSYWAPAMVDVTTGNGAGKFDMVPLATGPWTLPLQVYYKSG